MKITFKKLKRLIIEAASESRPQWLVVMRAGDFVGTGVIFSNDIQWSDQDNPETGDHETLARNGFNEEGAERKAEEMLSAQGPGWAQWCDRNGEPVDEDDDQLNEEFTSFDVVKVVNLAHYPDVPQEPSNWIKRAFAHG